MEVRMEKVDLSKVLIIDTPYYNPGSSYVGMLKRNNITTVNQLLDDSIWEYKCYTRTRSQLRGFIAMLKYYYFGEEPYYDVLLDKRIDLDFVKKGINYRDNFLYLVGNNYGNKNAPDVQISLTELLGCPEYMASYILRRVSTRTREGNLSEIGLEDNPKLIDLFKWILTEKRYKQVFPYIRSYIEIYNKRTPDIDYAKIDILVTQLMALEKMQKELDEQLAIVKKQLSFYSNIEDRNEGSR